MILSIPEAINNYMKACGGEYSDWYVGIAAHPRDRLFGEHKVDENRGAWIFRDAGSEPAARNIERGLLALGCRGGGGGGTFLTRYVYAYKVAPQTLP